MEWRDPQKGGREMTTSEVATPVSPHLSDHGVELLRTLLLCQMAEHADHAAECRATADELTGQTDSDSALERELAETSASKFMIALLETRQALERLDKGTYGICEGCATPIPSERLEAIPHARRCVSCPDSPGFLG
jgi:RNA polymerase-binding transcription factor DksA